MGGLPCIRDLRIQISAVVGQLAAGRSIGQILEDYPDLEHDDVLAALEYAAAGWGYLTCYFASAAGRTVQGPPTRSPGEPRG